MGIIKGGANVPAFVLEFLLANTTSTEDEQKLQEGMENVKTILRNHYVNPERARSSSPNYVKKGGIRSLTKYRLSLIHKETDTGRI